MTAIPTTCPSCGSQLRQFRIDNMKDPPVAGTASGGTLRL